jgi:hypothetical protein
MRNASRRRGHRRLAQHVERKRVAARLALARVVERFLDRPARHELPAEKTHREIHALADQRLAAFAQQRRERHLERALAAGIDDAARDEKTPRRGVDEKRRRRADMGRPVALADLVADQPVAGGRIGDSQQRFGETHERDAFAAVERELEHQRVDAAGVRALDAHRLGELRRERLRLRELVGQKARLADQRGDGLRFFAAACGRNALAQAREVVVRRGREGEIESCGHGDRRCEGGRDSVRPGIAATHREPRF